MVPKALNHRLERLAVSTRCMAILSEAPLRMRKSILSTARPHAKRPRHVEENLPTLRQHSRRSLLV